jgi:Uncharacterized protein conserved in bacteria
MMAYSEDHIALAAEYALGTLDADERAQVETMMAVDTEFTAIVHAWEYRLGVLNQMVGSIEPRPIVWENIRAAVGHSGPQSPMALPDASPPPPPVAAVVAEAATLADGSSADQSNVIQLSGRLRRWRNIASFATAAAAALIAMLGLQVYQPELLPNGLRPSRARKWSRSRRRRRRCSRRRNMSRCCRRTAARRRSSSRSMPRPGISRAQGRLDAPEAGKSFELWLISDRLPQPRSLGVIGTGEFTARAVLASYDANTINAATYAVTAEQAGGSPDGKPHATPVYTGKLIETVPATPR